MDRRWFQFSLRSAIVSVLLAGLLTPVAIRYRKRNILGITPELERIDTADAAADARNAIARGDFHFAGIFGLGLSAPGVDSGLQLKYGVKPIKGTSDCILSKEQGRLQLKAEQYAMEYNTVVLRALSEKQ